LNLKIFTVSKEMVRRSVVGWQGRQDLESDVLIYFNALPVPWFQTHTHKILVRIVASLIFIRSEIIISKILHQDSTHIWEVAPGRLLII